jgi:DNA repair exonuclease SbcCD nuclease subunit
MLLIGDIHITTRMTDRIITMLRDFVDANPTEKNIVFVGDYVYHFAYDRAALFALYDFFVQLFEQGKSLFVLAGNHDRLGDSFVYAEVKKAFDLLHTQSEGKLHFITQPQIHTIDGEDVLFFPYMIHKVSDMPAAMDPRTDLEQSIQTQITTLAASDNKNEQFSAYINALLLSYTQQYDSLTIIHHYYTNAIKFPGYASRFAFKDIALSDYFLDLPHIRLIS